MNTKILRGTLILGVLFFLTGFWTEQRSRDGQTIRINVEMVSLPVVVTTQAGKRITDLKKEDFRVFEDGVEQEIAGFAATDEPVAVALLLDTSGSTENELANIQNAAIDFVNQLHPDDEVAIVSFADDVRLQQDFSIDRDRNEYGIKQTRSGGSTVVYEAVWLGLEDVLKPVSERKAMVLFSDGVDTSSRRASRKETLELARETRATIYSVYYDTGLNQFGPRMRTNIPQFPPIILGPPVYGGPGSSRIEFASGRDYLEKLAEYSGGLTLDGRDDLRYAFAQVAKELASQYSIGYYSNNNKRDGKFRKVEIKMVGQELRARTKKGYYARKK